MKLEEGEKLVFGQGTCKADEDVMLTTRDGKAIRFAVDDVRVFAGRTSTGVRGIRLADPATRLSPCRSCAMSRRRRKNAPLT